jgi:aspartate aminotransferase-like enzyme
MKVKKLRHVAPAALRRRVTLEGVVAAVASVGAMRVEVDDWDTNEVVLGDDADTEGGNAYVPW